MFLAITQYETLKHGQALSCLCEAVNDVSYLCLRGALFKSRLSYSEKHFVIYLTAR